MNTGPALNRGKAFKLLRIDITQIAVFVEEKSSDSYFRDGHFIATASSRQTRALWYDIKRGKGYPSPCNISEYPLDFCSLD